MDICFYIPYASELISFVNSNFMTSLMGALFGAWAGALAAQRITERTKERDELLKQGRETNAAIMSAFVICNSFLSLKKQHVQNLCINYNNQKLELETHKKKLADGKVVSGTVYVFQANLLSLKMPLVPMDTLKSQTFEKLSLNGRPVALVSALASSIDLLESLILKRNDIIEKLKAITPVSSPTLEELYFGLPYNGGYVNSEYPDLMNGICQNVDDVIFFSNMLCKDLKIYGETIAEKYNNKYHMSPIIINEANFDIAEGQNLMPSENNYIDWLKGFQSIPSVKDKKLRWWNKLSKRRAG